MIATVAVGAVRGYVAVVRLFVVDPDAGSWNELTSGEQPVVRLAASDLQRAQRERRGIRAEQDGVAVILDLEVAVAPDVRSAVGSIPADDGDDGTVRYAGTVGGLAGLIADIERADVADGVTLIPIGPPHDPAVLGAEVLQLLALRATA